MAWHGYGDIRLISLEDGNIWTNETLAKDSTEVDLVNYIRGGEVERVELIKQNYFSISVEIK
ncbi:hypothetical protein [Paenibacillus pini]|uniref:Uncharacterized protein n=1 Tax=Paenibacillus pini JCM 16418 TaxID=1236976 RepID=W7Z8U0_9BACL|nr:hypothetical protein [Paenibacillus pini]GAF10884.1 hypothetical protein JCM16418_5115 [Paenibacillus pini JCM 16418]